jgi:hypothetical protein
MCEKKIEDLIERSSQFASIEPMKRDSNLLASCMSWFVEASNIIRQAIPNETNPYRRVIKDAQDKVRGTPEQIRVVGVSMKAMLSDHGCRSDS